MSNLTQGKTSKEHNIEQVARYSPEQALQDTPFADIQALQDAAGNRAVSHLLNSDTEKPQQSSPNGDKRVNRRWLKPLPSASASSKNAKGLPTSVRSLLGSGNERPLDSTIRDHMESRFGYDFSSIRIHSNRQAAESARTVRASAYVVGRDIVFGEGQYRPRTAAGVRLLAHELAHTIQQRPYGRDAATLSANSHSEASAESMAQNALHGRTISQPSPTGIGIARQLLSGPSPPTDMPLMNQNVVRSELERLTKSLQAKGKKTRRKKNEVLSLIRALSDLERAFPLPASDFPITLISSTEADEWRRLGDLRAEATEVVARHVGELGESDILNQIKEVRERFRSGHWTKTWAVLNESVLEADARYLAALSAEAKTRGTQTGSEESEFAVLDYTDALNYIDDFYEAVREFVGLINEAKKSAIEHFKVISELKDPPDLALELIISLAGAFFNLVGGWELIAKGMTRGVFAVNLSRLRRASGGSIGSRGMETLRRIGPSQKEEELGKFLADTAKEATGVKIGSQETETGRTVKLALEARETTLAELAEGVEKAFVEEKAAKEALRDLQSDPKMRHRLLAEVKHSLGTIPDFMGAKKKVDEAAESLELELYRVRFGKKSGAKLKITKGDKTGWVYFQQISGGGINQEVVSRIFELRKKRGELVGRPKSSRLTFSQAQRRLREHSPQLTQIAKWLDIPIVVSESNESGRML